jgi:predicted dehydrogenase
MGAAVIGTPFSIFDKKQNKKLRLGLIGSGWYGMVLMKAALKEGNVEVAAICDADQQHLLESSDELEKLQGKRPATFKAYQDLLKAKNLDAIFIGTQPHWHALQFIEACEKEYPVYCEKPLAYDIREGQAMFKAAEAARNIVQIGFQRRQSQAFQAVKDYIKSGKAGEIHQIKAQIHYGANIKDTTVQNPPQTLDWDLWCGPAPKLPYRPSIGHLSWRLEKEYGNGHLVDWGIHHLDIIRRIMDFPAPESAQAAGGIFVLKDKITTPDVLSATWIFNEIPVNWEHKLWGAAEYNQELNNGIFFYGTKATLFASDHKMTIIPNEKDAVKEEKEIRTSDMQERHVHEFLRAVRENKPDLISCHIEDAWHSTTTVHLAMHAYESGKSLNWNAKKHQVENNTEAAQLVMRPYRKGYQHPFKT